MNPPEAAPASFLEVHLTTPPVSKGQREYLAFRRLLPSLLNNFRGKYVAIHNEEVLDSDIDDIALIQRSHAKVGYVPIHVGLVTEVPATVRIPHYRQISVEGQK